MRRMAGGFTLIELMIAVVIIGVLAAIALPAYGNYVLRSNRTVGKSMLTEILGRQESYFVDRKQYAATLTALGYPANTIFLTRDGKPNAASTSNAVYSITVATYAAGSLDSCGFSGTPAAPVMQFAVVATPINAQVKDDKCQKLCVSSLGEKDQQGPDTSCWRS